MRAFALTALALFGLSACSPSAEAPAASEAAPEAAPVLAGVDLTAPLRALGTEPFWAVELTGSELVYSGVDRPEQRAPRSAPVIQGTMAIWEATTTAGAPLSVTLTATECSDGMSDRTYPLTALVKVGEETLTGCAASVSAINAAGESGLVVDTPQPAV
ncbi:MAG: COG3650 family protein [Brevundimonas sp.]|uniref:COG3650 family protein n=1 Tax=Brevundimonas sp. TaxID=1871086 RepID=UPI00391CD517